jgi:carboxypeptidase family protein
MRNPMLVGAHVAAIAVAALLAACDKEPKSIVGPSPNPVGANPNAQPVVVTVEISGPVSIPPGQSAHFTAISRLSDGTSQMATNVRWNSQTHLLQVDASGLATAGQQTGEGILSAEVTSSGGVRRGSKEILVLPDGTYRMVGVVTENVPPTTPIVGARVEVTSGAPIAAITDWEGRYHLYGVPATTDVRVTKDGYQPHVQRFQLAEHATQNFQLALSGTRLDLAGPYTLEIDTGCEPISIPVGTLDLPRLRYDAVLTQRESILEVVLTESWRFRVNGAGRGHGFSGRVDSAGATFNLRGVSWYYYDTYPDLVERMPDGTFLVVEGTAVTRGSRAGLSGDQPRLSFNRFDSRWPGVPPLYGSFIDFCSANLPFRFTLTPR